MSTATKATQTDIERYELGLNWRVTYLTPEKGTGLLTAYKVGYIDSINMKALPSHTKASAAIYQNVDYRNAYVGLLENIDYLNAYGSWSPAGGMFKSFLYRSPHFSGCMKALHNGVTDHGSVAMKRYTIPNPDYRG